MEIFISHKFLPHSNLLLSPTPLRFNFISNSLKPPSFPSIQKLTFKFNHKRPIHCSLSNSNSTNYGGWEDLALIQDSNHSSSKFDQFQSFLISIGIDDRKYAFMFILGLVSALAISRVRVSSILIFPASMFIFSLGFTFGFLRQGGVFTKDKTVIDTKKSAKDESFGVYGDTLRNLVELFSEVGVKIKDLEEVMRGAVKLDLDRVEDSEYESYRNAVNTVNFDILKAKSIVETTVNDISSFIEYKGELNDDVQGEKNLNWKSSKRKKEMGASYFDVFKIIGGLFQENVTVAKTNKVKDIAKSEPIEPLKSELLNNRNHNGVLVTKSEEVEASSSVPDNKTDVISSSLPEPLRTKTSSQRAAETSGDVAGTSESIPELVNTKNSPRMRNDMQALNSSERSNNLNYSSQFMNNGNFTKIRQQNLRDVFVPHDKLYDPFDLDVNVRSSRVDRMSFNMDPTATSEQVESPMASDQYLRHFPRRKEEEDERYEYDFVDKSEKSDEMNNSGNLNIPRGLRKDSASSHSSVISEDLMFSKHLTEATDLLKDARECLKGKEDEDRAEVMLYKSATLLSKAAAMKPMSLLAVGQLGNTFLLHGELKLRTSRELRSLLSKSESSRRRSPKVLKGLDEQNISRDKIASVLIDVCEECEGLLVEAGRQYRMALSIDGNDVRALYNWGLALSFRAQLIADIGPEAASDADKVYLAAIDKFNAMMSRNKAYAPDALYRWGVALQQRSRLRPNTAKEKKKLLYQAKSLFEDALYMDSNNIQVREALSSCISEIKYRDF
ncbi:hypothetical protein ACHQM5_003097 [Ranunculus cassubicifolius]